MIPATSILNTPFILNFPFDSIKMLLSKSL